MGLEGGVKDHKLKDRNMDLDILSKDSNLEKFTLHKNKLKIHVYKVITVGQEQLIIS